MSLTTFVEPAFFDDRDLIHGGSINTLSPSLGWLRAAGHAGGASDTVRSTRDKRGAVRVGAPSWALRPFGSVAGRAFGIAREPGSQGEFFPWGPILREKHGVPKELNVHRLCTKALP